MGLIVLKGPAEYDRRQTLWLDPFFDFFLHDAGRGPHAYVFPGFLTADRRQRSQVTFDQRLDRDQIETSDENEGKVTRVRKSIFVKGHRFIEVPFIHRRRRRQTPPEVVLVSGGNERVEKCKLWNCGLICENSLRLCCLDI